MNLISDNYFHVYNRQTTMKSFLSRPRTTTPFCENMFHYLAAYLDTIAYCLMPTHFHFLVFVKSDLVQFIGDRIGILLSSYTKAINNRYSRHGSLFQHHTKSRHVDDVGYLMAVVAYIHQNPKRSGLVERLEDWHYSSYPGYIGMCTQSFLNKALVSSYFGSIEDFKEFSKILIPSVEKKYWV